MCKKMKSDESKYEEAYDEIVDEKLLEGEVGYEPTDEEVWDRLSDYAEALYDDYCDSVHEQRRDERNGL